MMACPSRLVLIAAIACIMPAAAAQDEPSLRAALDALETRLLNETCSQENVEARLLNYAFFDFRSERGIECLGRALRLIGEAIPVAEQVTSRWVLWRLVEIARRDSNAAAARSAIATIAADPDHPLKVEAVLANAYLSQALPESAAIAEADSYGIETLISEAQLLRDAYRNRHPEYRRALVWWTAARIARDGLAPPSGRPAEDLRSGAQLANDIAQLALLPEEFAEGFLTRLFRTPVQIAPRPPAMPLVASSEIGDMSFQVRGQVCASGVSCDSVQSDITGDGTDSKGWENRWDGTSSIAQLGYRVASDHGPSGNSYLIGATAFARGGNQELNPLLHGGRSNENGTSTVTYSVGGTLQIRACADPAVCAPVVGIFVNGSEEERSGMSVTVIAADGTRQEVRPGNMINLDRTRQDHQLQVSLTRNLTHTGACCTQAPLAHWVGVDVREPYRVPRDGPFASRPFDGGLSYAWPFFGIGGALHAKADNLAGALPFLLGEHIRSWQGAPSYHNRYRTVLLRLATARLIRDRVWRHLSDSERTSLTTGYEALSRDARSNFLAMAQQELQLRRAELQALNFFEVERAISALIAGGDISENIERVHLDLIEATRAQAAAGPELAEALRTLESARSADASLDALLLLLRAREFLDALRDSKVEAIDRLQLEITQYQ